MKKELALQVYLCVSRTTSEALKPVKRQWELQWSVPLSVMGASLTASVVLNGRCLSCRVSVAAASVVVRSSFSGGCLSGSFSGCLSSSFSGRCLSRSVSAGASVVAASAIGLRSRCLGSSFSGRCLQW